MSLKKGTTALRDFTFTPSTQSLDRERLQVTKTVQKHKQLVPLHKLLSTIMTSDNNKETEMFIFCIKFMLQWICTLKLI